jgi:hypothetical protein
MRSSAGLSEKVRFTHAPKRTAVNKLLQTGSNRRKGALLGLRHAISRESYHSRQ